MAFWKIIIFLLVLLILFEVGQFLIYFQKARTISDQTESFSYKPDDINLRILVAGDSTAAGAGTKPINSVAGRFHQDFPEAEIVNLGKSGYKIKDVRQSLEQTEDNFDLAILHAGANDILYFTALSKAKTEMGKLLTEANKISDNVILITSGDIGKSPILPFPVGWYYSSRSKKYLNTFEEIAKQKEVAFVDIYNSEKNVKFEKEPDKYYAPDKIHLSGEGYKLWYDQIRETMKRNNIKLKNHE